MARRAGIALLILIACLAVLFLLLHLPWVQARAGRALAARLAASGLAIETRVFRYNLWSLSVHVEGLTASSTTDRAQPFLEAGRLDVQVPRSIFAGRLALTSLVGDGLRVTIIRRPDGSTNLPAAQGGGSTPPRFDIGTLSLSNITVEWRDEVLDASARVEGASIDLRPGGSNGTISSPRPATVRIGRQTTTVTANGRWSWDGSRLSIASLGLETPEATVTAMGTVGALEADTPLAIDATGSADVSRVAAWFDPAQRPSGRVAFTVHAAGPAADPKADVRLSSSDLGWQKLTSVRGGDLRERGSRVGEHQFVQHPGAWRRRDRTGPRPPDRAGPAAAARGSHARLA